MFYLMGNSVKGLQVARKSFNFESTIFDVFQVNIKTETWLQWELVEFTTALFFLQHKLGPNFYETGRHMMQLIGGTNESDDIGRLLVRIFDAK